MAAGAVTLGANTTDVIDLGIISAVLNLSAFTIYLECKPTTLTSTRQLMCIGQTAVIQSPQMRLNGTTGNFEVSVQRGGPNALYVTTDTPLSSLGAWKGIVAIYNEAAAAGSIIRIFHGPPGGACVESTYTKTDGVGATASNTGASLIYGNRNLSTPDRPLQGSLGILAIFAAAFTPAEAASMIRMPRARVGAYTAVEFGRSGLTGASYKSYSGATASISGGVQANGPRMNVSRLHG